MAQDDDFYEIQLTNKQLVFYFVAGSAGLVLAFLAGVMVGRGIDDGAPEAGTAQVVAEERVVPEAAPSPQPTDFSYAQRLEADRPVDRLDVPATTVPPATAPPATAPPAATPTPAAARPTPTQRARPVIPTPRPTPTPPATKAAALPRTVGSGPTAHGFAVQVGSFKDRSAADEVVKRLRGRGLPAFSVAPAGQGGGFFPVRVGVYRDRADARTVQEHLRADKFEPIIIKQ